MQAAEGFRFLDVDMPNQFVLECLDAHGEWIDWELNRAAKFERQEDGCFEPRPQELAKAAGLDQDR